MLKQFSNILQVSKNVLLKVVGGVLILLFLLFGVLQLDIVQTKLAQNLAEYLSQKINHKIEIEKISIRWFDVIHIEEVYVEDDHGREMMWVEAGDVDYNISSMFMGDMIVVDHFEVLRPRFGMVQYVGSNQLNINEMIDKIAQAFASDDEGGPSKPTPFLLRSAHVTDGVFFYDDQRFDTLKDKGRFDESHFYIDSIYSGLTDLYIHHDTVQLYAHHLSAIDIKTKILVKDLSTLFRYTDHSLEFYEMDCHVNNSYIADQVIFRYKEPVTKAFSDFSTKVRLEMSLKNTSIHTKDLAWFAPGIRYLNDTWKGTGRLRGTVSNFRSKNFKLQFGKRSTLQGKMEFDGLPDFFETLIDLELKKSNVYPEDLDQYVTAREYYSGLLNLGDIKFNSTFYGFPLNFSTIGDFDTELGSLHSDVTLKVGLGKEVSSYRGYIKSEEFLIGKYLENDYINGIAVDGNVVGQGFSLDDAIIDLDAKVDHFDMNGYRYKNIDVDGVLRDRFFIGHLDVNDSNLVMTANGEFNLKPNVEKVKIKASVERAYPNVLGFIDDSCAIATTLDVDFKGFSLETIEGSGDFKNSEVYYKGNSLTLKHFGFASRLNDSIRLMAVESNLISAFVTGNYKFSEAYGGMTTMLSEFKLKVRNEETEIEEYYRKKKSNYVFGNTELDFRIDLKHPQPVFDLVFPELEVSEGSEIKGEFKNTDTLFFHVDAKFDSLKYKGIKYAKNTLDVIASKSVLGNDVSGSYYVGSLEQWSSSTQVTKGLMLGGYWDKDV